MPSRLIHEALLFAFERAVLSTLRPFRFVLSEEWADARIRECARPRWFIEDCGRIDVFVYQSIEK